MNIADDIKISSPETAQDGKGETSNTTTRLRGQGPLWPILMLLASILPDIVKIIFDYLSV